jgi:2-polyprenyl-6-methoxyphenol hydroxylase-like FAD-dependent oxidoreductase
MVTSTAFAAPATTVATASAPQPASPSEETADVIVVGGGPAGILFGYIAARAGLRVVLLEAAKDFNRAFRGDTLNALALELLDQLGLADDVLALPHNKVDTLRASAPGQPPFLLTYRRLRTRFPYIMIISQPLLLEFLAAKAAAFPTFDLRMRTRITGLVEEGGAVRGITYQHKDGGSGIIRAPLTIGADGRASVTRELSGLPVRNLTRVPSEVIWLTLPLQQGDPEEGLLSREDTRNNIFLYRRPAEWQIGVTVQRGSYRELRAAGIAAFRAQLAELLPEFAARLAGLEWNQTALLNVELKRAERWHRDGLLLIGDAAHVMSPLGGVGINLAIRDAVLAANAVIGPLRLGRLRERDLAKVQRQAGWDVGLIQRLQAFVQNQAVAEKVEIDKVIALPTWLRTTLFALPVVRDLPVRLLAFGLIPVRVSPGLREPALAG